MNDDRQLIEKMRLHEQYLNDSFINTMMKQIEYISSHSGVVYTFTDKGFGEMKLTELAQSMIDQIREDIDRYVKKHYSGLSANPK